MTNKLEPAKRRKIRRNTPGRPFQKGDDPRRHLHGSKCKDAVSFGAEFNRELSSGGDPAALAALLWKRALAGHAWAIEMILDRLIGRPTLSVNLGPKEPTIYRIVYAEDPKGPAETDPAVIRESERLRRLTDFTKGGEGHDPSKN